MAGVRPRLEIARAALGSARSHQIGDAAAAITYYVFTALPSALVATLGLGLLLGGRSTADALVRRAGGVLPAGAVSLLRSSLERTVAHERQSAAFLAVGICLVAWSATGAMTAVMRGLNRAYGVRETRGAIRVRIEALELLVVTAAGVLAAVGLVGFGPVVAGRIARATGLPWLEAAWWLAEGPLSVAILATVVAGVLVIGPSVEGRRWRPISGGAMLAVVLWLAISGLFGLYVSRFGSYGAAWGSLSAVVVTLVWIWLGALALLLGAELDAELERRAANAAVPATVSLRRGLRLPRPGVRARRA